MKNQEGRNQGLRTKNIPFYSIGKTLFEKFPDWFEIVLEHHNTDLPLSLISEFVKWYKELFGTEQEYTESEGCNSEYEYRDQLIICVVALFQSNFFTTKKTVLRTRLRSILSHQMALSPTTISHRLSKMKFENGDVIPCFKPIINSAKIIAETFCLERGIEKKFDIGDALVLQHEADEWEMQAVIEGLESEQL